MLNAEKYKYEILRLVKQGIVIAFDDKRNKLDDCLNMDCKKCYFYKNKNTLLCRERYYEWLLSECKERILDETEREYLSNLCAPFEVLTIKRSEGIHYQHDKNINAEWITIIVKCNGIDKTECVFLPLFIANTMYKGMEPDKEYKPQELGIKCKNNPKGEIRK